MDNDHDPAAQAGSAHAHARRADHALPGGAFAYDPGEPAALPALARNTSPLPVTDNSGVTIDRLRHEQDLARSGDLYLLAPVAYFLLAFDSAVLQVNLVGATMLGVARANPGLHHFRTFVVPAFLPDFDGFFARALNSSTGETCRMRLRTPDAGGVDVTLHGSADGSGQACRLIVERAEGKLAALERSEERLRRIVHSAGEGIWEIDRAANTTFVNPRMARMLGYSIEEMLARPLLSFMDDDGIAMLEQCLAGHAQGAPIAREYRFIGKDGRVVWTCMSTSAILDADGVCLGALALVTDITEHKQSTELIWHQANYDALTGLPNRHMFMDRLRHETRKADRGAAFLALLFIDLDHFKAINDRLGHARGDLVLMEASRRLASCVRSSDTLARLGGDEFTVILSGLDHIGSVERIAHAIVAALALPFDLAGEMAFVSASVGIALYPPDARDIDQLVERADRAMYAAKNAGGHQFSYVTQDLQQAAQARQSIAADLRAAIALGQFEIVYQPIVSLRTGAVHKAEALLRWRHPVRGLLGPAEFIPFAESNGLIVEIGDWVFREVAQQVQRWQRSIDPLFQVSVNKSPVQFRHDADLYLSWLDYLTELGLPAHSIVIEITEGVLFEGAAQVIERLRQFRAMGLQVALDDFGTGYSSLSHLKRFDIDYVKIDQSFVATLENDVGDLALCEAIIVMAHKLGLKVVAEGVETKVQRALLVDAGCDFAQGYVFARPMPAQEFEAMAAAGMQRLPH
ncbi:putative bifunctional diguanylate cyclase/phosphodiesterase [Massilia antarctica]|uniref:putative bifunctional diguanylate cyclase/phosphodiesterase n=1 Tax=Massilia antarctica TaxID=2765360 RepID=UPI0006BD9D15|nr:EAL domain-containing protein [Massilia sp. H27-R4]MCY0912521.1 EAL domain-containing protein [Massilia sp. H27-R4]CUI03568.1 diguanylate cyclase/phosphodiesterase (GGDEF & EAL domains) with PAS/PAC sensor(s) [Janthinobacterium sp. CG23_2]CUU27354.1 diguanylate cyclase/phosphodiesterase (GGDEF & EAL domains) with PAS/PAC sensor(s) [Janthinobacterium sp. CG23_2]